MTLAMSFATWRGGEERRRIRRRKNLARSRGPHPAGEEKSETKTALDRKTYDELVIVLNFSKDDSSEFQLPFIHVETFQTPHQGDQTRDRGD